MNERDKKYFDILLPMAEDILNRRWRHVACVVHKNQIISFGMSQKKSHPFAAKYGGKHGKSMYWHAETQAIHNALQKIDENQLSKSTLYVMRLKYEDSYKKRFSFGMSKPCNGCQKCIDEYGIGRVVYSIENNGGGIHYGIYEKTET